MIQTLAILTESPKSEKGFFVQTMPYPGMEKVVSIIKAMIEQYRNRPFVRQKALEITAGIEDHPQSGHQNMRDFDAIANAIYDFVIEKIIYTRDPHQVERLQMPGFTLKAGSGDCDDMVLLSGALLQSVGVPTRIRLLGETPEAFTHILLQYKANGQWKSFDPTLALYPGYQIPESRIKKEKIVSLTPITPESKRNGRKNALPSLIADRRPGSSYILI